MILLAFIKTGKRELTSVYKEIYQIWTKERLHTRARRKNKRVRDFMSIFLKNVRKKVWTSRYVFSELIFISVGEVRMLDIGWTAISGKPIGLSVTTECLIVLWKKLVNEFPLDFKSLDWTCSSDNLVGKDLWDKKTVVFSQILYSFKYDEDILYFWNFTGI